MYFYNQNYGTKVDITSTDFDGVVLNNLTKIVSNLRYNLSEEAKKKMSVFIRKAVQRNLWRTEVIQAMMH